MSDNITLAEIMHSITKLDVYLYDQKQVYYQTASYSAIISSEHNTLIYQKIGEKMATYPDDPYIYFQNISGLNYIGIHLSNPAQVLIIGPFISEGVSAKIVLDDNKKNQELYQLIPALTDEEIRSVCLIAINLKLPDKINNSKIQIKSEEIPLQIADLADLENQQMIIENNYQNEKKAMHIITKGNLNKAKETNFNLKYLGTQFGDRVIGSPLRSAKNITIVFNTLCRIAAERGGVTPLYLHQLSEKYAILIERSSNLKDLNIVQDEMLPAYCRLVQQFSVKNYPVTIQKAIEHIQINLKYPLTLEAIAKAANVNPSYLSRKFKALTGQTLTDFITEKRIDEAKFHLAHSTEAITDIALNSGFNDTSYFIKVFKKATQLTPNEYRQSSKAQRAHDEML